MLTDRKLKVLEAIISDFISSAQPVGSRTIAKKYLVGISPATIRNEMADLEELGYLFQPHTSAGRIPSDLAYRHFVDQVTVIMSSGIRDMRAVHSSLYTNVIEPEELAKRAVKLLSEKTSCVAVVSLPSFGKARLENLRIVKVTEDKALMILVAAKGEVRTVELAGIELSQVELDAIADYLLEDFLGKCIDEISISSMKQFEGNLLTEIGYFIPSMRAAIKTIRADSIEIGGMTEMIVKNEIDSDTAKKLHGLLSNKEYVEAIIKQFSEAESGRLVAKIGNEFDDRLLWDFSMILKKYSISQAQDSGVVAIIGPKRMDYKAVGSIVNTVANSLTEIFSGIHL